MAEHLTVDQVVVGSSPIIHPMGMIASADGCKAGWVVVVSDSWPCITPPTICVCKDFSSLIATTSDCTIVVIDMPIGLPIDCAGRVCDSLARKLLGSMGAGRVFPAPPRAALRAETPTTFQRIHRQLAGVGASLPVWGIVPKLRDVDATMTPELQTRVMEFHPELAWARLAGHVLTSKHKPNGLDERRTLLEHYVDSALIQGQLSSRLRNGVWADDVLDALIGLMVAQEIKDGQLPRNRLPLLDVPLDERGLRMEIWF